MADRQYFNVSGRIVQGNVFEPQTKDMQGRPMLDMKGAPKVQYFLGLAVAKDAPDFQTAWAGVQAAAAIDWPGGEPQRAGFSFKLVDGDAPENASKEGFPGHWILRFTSGFAWQAVAQGAARPIVDPNEIKRGYYVRVFFTTTGNKNAQKPGMYLNASVIELLGYGPEITSGPDAAGMIAQAGGAHTPAGVQATPLPGAPVAPVGMPPAVPPVGMPPVGMPPVAPPVGMPPVAPPGVIPPNPAILTGGQ